MHHFLAGIAIGIRHSHITERLAYLLAVETAFNNGHPRPDIYAKEYWRRHSPEAVRVFLLLVHPFASESKNLRSDLVSARFDLANLLLE